MGGCSDITAIVATLNSEKTLRVALSSLESAIPEFISEVIIIDGGSRDKTVDIAREFKVGRILQQKSKGLYAALNEAVQTVRTSHLMFVHSDDWIVVKGQPTVPRSNVEVVVFPVEFYDAEGRRCLYQRKPVWFPPAWLRRYPFILHPNAIYPADALRAFPFDEEKWGPEADMHQIADMARHVRFTRGTGMKYCFRISGSSTTVRNRRKRSLCFWAFRTYVFLLFEDRRFARILNRFTRGDASWNPGQVGS